METLQEKISYQGKSLPKVLEQIKRFETGFPFLNIDRPAQITDGIHKLSDEQLEDYGNLYCQKKDDLKVVKFVPASGAASRMFKQLYEFLSSDGNLAVNSTAFEFLNNLKKFPFYEDLNASLINAGSFIDLALQEKNFKLIISRFLNEEGLGYGRLPKGLLKFHQYETHERTPVHEHFIEGLQYGLGKESTVRLHFTVSGEHLEGFKAEAEKVKSLLEKQKKVKFEISFSQQKTTTDTIAVNRDNSPFLNEDGTVLFRPAGHGALLSNLQDIDADLIFIKNIDNVSGERAGLISKRYKMAMAGMMLQKQARIFHLLEGIKSGEVGATGKAERFLQEELEIKFPKDYWKAGNKEQLQFLIGKLARPIRVCGMVRNTGEPGGGPFWVKNEDGSISLQIVEKAQISPEDQDALLTESTHFNPVDMVCSIKKSDGGNYQLDNFSDPETGLISEKSLNGKVLKALELPGLWNGSMSDWNTLFVEVPLETFNPVKTINDLLRDAHQINN